jgi:hypothetical protein
MVPADRENRFERVSLSEEVALTLAVSFGWRLALGRGG